MWVLRMNNLDCLTHIATTESVSLGRGTGNGLDLNSESVRPPLAAASRLLGKLNRRPTPQAGRMRYVQVSMHRKRLMMSVDWCAHLPIRARKLANVLNLVHSNGFNSPSMVHRS